MMRWVTRAVRGASSALMLALVPGVAEAYLVSAVLPSSRSVQVGTPATVFATIINAGETTAEGCSVSLGSAIPAAFGYQTTDPDTNLPVGMPDEPVDIPAGEKQSFVLVLTPTEPIEPTEVSFTFQCGNMSPASVWPGINTLSFVASTDPVPDIVALAATQPPPGVLSVTGAGGAFAVATINLGTAGEVTGTPDTGGAVLPLTLSVCETVPATGACKTLPPTPSVTLTIEAGATPTFGVFASATADVPLDPAANRLHMRFEQAGVLRGSTSVAVTASVGGCGPAPAPPPLGSLALTGAEPEWGESFVPGTAQVTPMDTLVLVQWDSPPCPYAYAVITGTGLSSVTFVGPTTFYTRACSSSPGSCSDLSLDTVAKTLTFTNASFPGLVDAVPIGPAIVNGTLSYQ